MWHWPDVGFHSNIDKVTSACARVCMVVVGIIASPGVTFGRSAVNATVTVVGTTCHTAATQHLCMGSALVTAAHARTLPTRQFP